VQSPTSVEGLSEGLPTSFALAQNYPNPFNSTTTIQFTLAKRAIVKLKVFNIVGTEVAASCEHQSNP